MIAKIAKLIGDLAHQSWQFWHFWQFNFHHHASSLHLLDDHPGGQADGVSRAHA
jgi:hypothetical protein